MSEQPRHRAEPEHEVFEPGSRIRFKGDRARHVFLVLVGGYTHEGAWHFFSTDRPFTSADFERVAR